MQLKLITIFIALLIILPLIYFCIRFIKGRTQTYKMPGLALFKRLSSQQNNKNRVLHYSYLVTKVLFIFVLIILISRPIAYKQYSENRNGIDIIFTIDMSLSMIAGKDVAPTRFVAAQEVISGFVKDIPNNNRIGLVGFSGMATTLSPLSFDSGIISYTLNQINDDSISYYWKGKGTAVGDGLLLSTEKFEKDKDRTKIVILITDGESNSGVEIEAAAQHAKKQKVKVHTILMSASGQGSRAGQELSAVAQTTGGTATIAQNRNSFESILEKIKNEEVTEIEASQKTVTFDNPQTYFILAGLLLALLSFIKIFLIKF